MTEEAFEETLEQWAAHAGSINIESLESTLLLVGVVLTFVVYGFIFINKKQKEAKTVEELSQYYDDYMASEVDMNFEDYIFCRRHHIDVDKKIEKLPERTDDEED